MRNLVWKSELTEMQEKLGSETGKQESEVESNSRYICLKQAVVDNLELTGTSQEPCISESWQRTLKAQRTKV